MAKDKKSFIAYCDWLESFEELSDDEAGRLAKHLFRYVSDLNPEAPDKLTKMCFIPIQQSLKRDLKKYEGYIDKQRDNGKLGGRPKNPKEPKEPTALFGNPTEPKKADSVNDSVNVNDNDSVNESTDVDKRRTSVKDRIPTLQSFIDYGLEKAAANKLNVSERSLSMKYEAWKVAGWLNGNGDEIRNWKASLLNTLPHIVDKPNGKQPIDKNAAIVWDDQAIKDYIENPFISKETKDAFMQERMREASNRIHLDMTNTLKLNA
jgi:hypothetical protein